MSLTIQTSLELENLAQAMVSKQIDTILYKNFGTLVRKDSEEFKNFEKEIILGEVEVNNEKFILFNK